MTDTTPPAVVVPLQPGAGGRALRAERDHAARGPADGGGLGPGRRPAAARTRQPAPRHALHDLGQHRGVGGRPRRAPAGRRHRAGRRHHHGQLVLGRRRRRNGRDGGRGAPDGVLDAFGRSKTPSGRETSSRCPHRRGPLPPSCASARSPSTRRSRPRPRPASIPGSSWRPSSSVELWRSHSVWSCSSGVGAGGAVGCGACPTWRRRRSSADRCWPRSRTPWARAGPWWFAPTATGPASASDRAGAVRPSLPRRL